MVARTMTGLRVRSLFGLLDASDGGRSVKAPVSGSSGAWSRQRGDGEIVVSMLAALLMVGSVLGLMLPASDELHGPYRRISAVIGWTYFSRWAAWYIHEMLYRRTK